MVVDIDNIDLSSISSQPLLSMNMSGESDPDIYLECKTPPCVKAEHSDESESSDTRSANRFNQIAVDEQIRIARFLPGFIRVLMFLLQMIPSQFSTS